MPALSLKPLAAQLGNAARNRVIERVDAATWASFQLTALDGLDNDEAAGRLGLTKGQVAVNKHRVKEYLKREIALLEGADAVRHPGAP